MNWNAVFQLPEACVQRIPITKKSLVEQDGLTLSESRKLSGAEVSSIHIIGVISRNLANIQDFVQEEFSFLEVFFILVKIQNSAYESHYKAIPHILHKLIPHHCVVITETEDETKAHLSLGVKRISLNSPQLRTLIEEVSSNEITLEQNELLEALSFEKANKLNLKVFYEYYKNLLNSHKLVDLTEEFKIRSLAETEELRKVQEEIEEYELQINSKRRELKSITQMNERVKINTDINQLKNKIDQLKQKI